MYHDPTLYQGASRCPDIDPEYMPFEREHNSGVHPGNLGCELATGISCVARSSEL
jgi:hypothetical protein